MKVHTIWSAYVGDGNFEKMEAETTFPVPEGITQSQQDKIFSLVSYALQRVGESNRRNHPKEIKHINIKRLADNPGDVSYTTLVVDIEYGMVDDEGTAAEYFCRDRWYGFIGIKGGLTVYVYGKGRQVLHGREAKNYWMS